MTPNPNGFFGDRYARVVIPMVDQQLWRRTGQAIRCPNASTDPCDYPACNCHQPQAAEACTEVGAEDRGEGSGALIWLAVGAVVLAALGFGVSLLLPLITP